MQVVAPHVYLGAMQTHLLLPLMVWPLLPLTGWLLLLLPLLLCRRCGRHSSRSAGRRYSAEAGLRSREGGAGELHVLCICMPMLQVPTSSG